MNFVPLDQGTVRLLHLTLAHQVVEVIIVRHRLVSARGTMHMAVQLWQQVAALALLAALQAVLDEVVGTFQSAEELQRQQEWLK